MTQDREWRGWATWTLHAVGVSARGCRCDAATAPPEVVAAAAMWLCGAFAIVLLASGIAASECCS